ncbi:MAG: hypothetical protein LUC17_01250 [Oscillospiraceae bacterium]|nr:hypothetical protein [Oscillospiraceae bacterium]
MKKYIKSSVNIPDDIRSIVWDLFDDYFLYDEDMPGYEDLEEEYDIDKNTYNKVVSFFNELDSKLKSGEIETYIDDRVLFLELSDRHVFWDLESEEDIPLEYLEFLIDHYLADFKEQTGIDVYLLGRSNRHACVDFTLENIINYDNLKYTWENYENDFIDDVNNERF